MQRIFLALALALAGATSGAQELSLLAGGLKESGTAEKTPVWAFEYQQGLGEHFAGSFSWLNEGHVPGHHRDGQAVQLWTRANVFDRGLSIAAGVGPYRYFDTTVSTAGGSYANIHGWATVGSLEATWYTRSRWLYQLRLDRIIAKDSINTSSIMLGVGYQLEPVAERGPRDHAPYQLDRTTGNEITAFFGGTIVNSYESEHDAARALEFRRGIARYVDVTVGLLNEGDPRLVRRTGVTTQLWLVRDVLTSDKLILGVGVGPYFAIDRYRTPTPGEASNRNVSWIVTAAAAYRISPRWDARFSWNRIDTDYNRDTDVVLFGLGYRF